MSTLVTSLRRRQIGDTYLAIGIVAVGLYFLIPANSVPQAIAYTAIAASSVVAIAAGAVANLPRDRRLPWYLFALGTLAFAVGDSIFDAYTIGTGTLPFPSAADWVYLSAYPILFLGMLLVIRPFGRREGRFVLLEAAIVTAGFLLVQWVFLFEPIARTPDTLVNRSISVTYPVMDVLLVATLAPLLLTRVARNRAFFLLTAAILTLLVADEVYYSHGVLYRWLDAFWLASYVCWGAAALQPSVAQLAAGQKEREPGLSVVRVGLLAAALGAAPTVLVVERTRHRDLHPYLVASFAFAIGGLVLLRTFGVIRALNEHRLQEGRARADAEFAARLITEQNTKLRELDRLKDEFVGMISHDLRTPLTSISGYVELLQDEETGPLNDEQRSFLEVVARNAERLLHIVSDLLFVARLQAGRLDLRLEDVDLAEVAAHAVEAAGPAAEAKGLTLDYIRDGAALVVGEDGRLAQLFDNLLSNAIKFTPEGGHVSVRVAAEDHSVVVEISDSGIGIPEHERRQLFERFFRASTAVAGQIPGTGLGLYISKAITEAHGGRIDVESDEGHGTTFRVTLPRAGG